MQVWQDDYLSLSKPSTQAAAKTHIGRLKAAFGSKDMRDIDAGDIQRLISKMSAEGLNPKYIRNLWGVVNLIWAAALAQKYVDAMLPKPKLPKRLKTKPPFFNLEQVGNIIAASDGEQRVLYWLLAETGIRSGELAGLRLTDINGDRLTVNQSVWHGGEQQPKTDNAIRTIALSPQLVTLLWEQIMRQKKKGHQHLFTNDNGTPLDMDNYRKREMNRLLSSLGILVAGKKCHAFRHFNGALLQTLLVPLKTIQERLGHALTGSFTLDVYGHSLDSQPDVDAARKAGAAITEAVRKAKEQDSGGNPQNSGDTRTAEKKKASNLELEAVEN